MSWPDVWGSSPCRNARELAEAFREGRTLRRSGCHVDAHPHFPYCWAYYYKDRIIAYHTPERMIPDVVAQRLLGRSVTVYPFRFAPTFADRAEARHLQALGVDAEWQWGGRPFLCFGADIGKEGWITIEQAKALPKWVEPPKPARRPRPEQFVNLTMPLEFV